MYTVSYCDQFMDELLDKMGSDYFPLPIKLSRFRSIVLQFIRETTNFLEGTQEISDDIVSLVKPQKITLSNRVNYMGKEVFRIEYPEDYLRLLNIVFTDYKRVNDGMVHYLSEQIVDSEIKLYKIGNFAPNERNPFRKPQGEMVNIYRIDNGLIVDTKQNLKGAKITYVKMPIFGVNKDDAIVNIHNNIVVDKLMHKTCVSLRATSSDEDVAFMDEYVERQGQKNK